MSDLVGNHKDRFSSDVAQIEPSDAKTVTLGTDLSVRISHSCQILIFFMLECKEGEVGQLHYPTG